LLAHAFTVAAGLAVNTVYGAQEYWPEEKLRM